jgi:hypothetical protein
MYSVTEESQNTYKSGFNRFLRYCEENKIDVSERIDYHMFEGFVAFLAIPTKSHPLGLHYSTILNYISSVKKCAQDHGIAIPDNERHLPRLQKMIQSLKKRQRGNLGASRMPVTVELCALIRKELNLKTHKQRVFWAMLSTGVQGLMRLGELTTERPLSAQYAFKLLRDCNLCHFRDGKCEGYSVLLHASKTDWFRETVSVHIFYTGGVVCAASALECLLSQCPFPRTARTPLFELEDGSVLSRPSFLHHLRQLIARVSNKYGFNLDENKFSGHSLRRGGATSLSLQNVSPDVIQLMGRWKSDAYKRYIVTPRLHLYTTTVRLFNPSVEATAQEVGECLRSLSRAFNPEEDGLGQ